MRRVALPEVEALSAGLTAAHIDVYFFDCDTSAFDDTLSETERARCARFATPLLRDRFRACHAGKRAILARYLRREPRDLGFVAGPFDKPHIGDGALGFNLSHSANWVAMAISVDEIGVDCERIDDTVDYRDLFGAVAHPDERIGDRHAFYRTWTRKEAVMKQLGLGFQLVPTRVQVPDPDAPLHDWQAARIVDGDTGSPVSAPSPLIVDVQAPPGYCAALAAESPRDVRVFQLFAGHVKEGEGA